MRAMNIILILLKRRYAGTSGEISVRVAFGLLIFTSTKPLS
jgi:hypothetical protein